MMENSPDPGETEEEDEEESSHCSRTNPSLLEEIRQLSQASNNNCSYEGKAVTYATFYLGSTLVYNQTKPPLKLALKKLLHLSAC